MRIRRPPASLLVAGYAVTVLVLTGVAASSTSAPPPLIGLSGARLVALDPRTLEPLKSPRPWSVGPSLVTPRVVLSPDGSHLAVLRLRRTITNSSGGYSLAIVDRMRLRTLRTTRPEELEEGSGQDIAWSKRGSFIFVYNENLDARGVVFGRCARLDLGGSIDYDAAVAVRTRDGIAVLTGGTCFAGDIELDFYPPVKTELELNVALDPAVPVAIAVDAHRNRLFVVSATGSIAVVSLRNRHLEYHSAALPAEVSRSDSFSAAWVGAGHLAIWGPSGLTLIDTSDWTARLVDPAATDAAVAPSAVVAWNRKAPTGITVYAPDGSVRFRALAGHTVLGVGVSARYAYINGGGRFSVDLHNGRVTGPLRSRAKLVLPDLLDLP